MPLYEFQCTTCGPFEQLRSLAEMDLPIACPTCEALAQRVFAPPRFQLSTTLRLRDCLSSEPQVVKRHQEPAPPRYHTHPQGRPWMISH